MRHMLTVACYELLRLTRHRSTLLLLFVMPLLVILILGSSLSVFFVSKPIQMDGLRLAVLMEDESFIRDSFRRELNESGQVKTVISAVSDLTELQGAVSRGDADAGVLVPSGFSERLQQGLKPEWRFFAGNNAMKSTASLQMLESFFDGWNQRLADSRGAQDTGELQKAPILPEPSADEAGLVKLTGWNGADKTYTALQYYSAHMLVMFMLYFGMTAAANNVTAKMNHTLARLRSLPLTEGRILLGSLAGQSMVQLLQAGLLIAGTALLYGVDWGNRLGLLVVLVGLVMVFIQSLSVILSVLMTRREYVIGLYQVFVILSTVLAGGFSPTIGDTLAAFSPMTVNYWATQGLLRLMLHEDPAVIAGYIRGLAWFSAGGTAAALMVFAKVGYHE